MSRISTKVEVRQYLPSNQEKLRRQIATVGEMLQEKLSELHPHQCPLAHSQLEDIHRFAEVLSEAADDLMKLMEPS